MLSDLNSPEAPANISSEELDRTSRLILFNQIVSIMRHELNQPLAALLLYTDAAMELAASYESAPLNDCLLRVVNQVRQTRDLLRDKFASLSPLSIRRERVEIKPLIAEVLNFLASELGRCSITTVLELSDDLCFILADKMLLMEVLLHLFRNALEAMNSCDDRDRTLQVRTEYHSHNIRVSIADSGPGLDPEIAKRLFVPFQSTKHRGLGLGLAICQNLIEAQGGSISLEKSTAAGTTFYFELPHCSEEKAR